jgi:aryl-alcohol dehydrogenase-like predicted oxidoreductase
VIPTRPFGRTGVAVTQLGLGGEGILRTRGRREEAVALIETALEEGIRYFDTAPAYAESMDYYGAALGERQPEVFLASKTASRSRDGSLAVLDDSLQRLRTTSLDLWQLHDVQTQTDLKRIFGPRGAIHALDEAREAGAIRFTGLTGHHRPDILLRAMREYAFDAVLIPLNPADHVRLPFADVLAEAHRRGMAVIAMKVLSTGLLVEFELCSAADALRYVWSLAGVSVAIVGCNAPGEVFENAHAARTSRPMMSAERGRLEQACAFSVLTPYKASYSSPRL